jgi:DNA-binding SARP family transcriptional activator
MERPLAQLHLLGGFRLATASRQDASPRGVKTQAMLAYLAMAPAGQADRGRLSGLLWSSGIDAKASLRQAIREAREALAADADALLLADRLRVSLGIERLWVDAREVEQLVRSAHPQDSEALARLYLGDLLDGFDGLDPAFDEWLLVERERLRRNVVETLEAWLDEPNTPASQTVAHTLLNLEPTQEVAHRALMRSYAARGETAAALRQYQTCRDALARELDVAPSAETEAVARQIRDAPRSQFEPRAPPSSAAVPSRVSTGALVAVEPKALNLAEFTDQSVAAALAAGLRQALSRMRWLSVVDASLHFPEVGSAATLPVPTYYAYVSLLRVRDRIRITIELKDGSTGHILWAEHYDCAVVDNVLSLLDTLAVTLAAKIEEEVRVAETMRAMRKPPESLSSYECVLRAIPLIFKLTPESFTEAEKLLLQAQEADPHDSMVYAWRAFWYSIDIGQDWVRDLDSAKSELDFLVRRAIELDPKNPLALSVAGHIASYVNYDYERAHGLFEQSLRIDPSSAYAWDSSAVTLSYAGKAKEALRRIEASREIWQQHSSPYYFQTTACIALLLAGQPERAAAMGQRTVRDNPNFQAAYRPLIASLGLIGKVGEARAYLADLQRLHPDFSIGWFRSKYPPLRGEGAERYLEGLRKAGVEE